MASYKETKKKRKKLAKNPRVSKVIPSKRWKNKKTGATASLYGALPYTGRKDAENWELETVGWTWQLDDGTIGLGRVPAATKEEAIEVMNRVNAISQRNGLKKNPKKEKKSVRKNPIANEDLVLKAITTKFVPPTNTKGSRVKVESDAGSMFVPWDHGLDRTENHAAAAEKYMKKMGWDERMKLVGGGTKNGYVFVQIPKGSVIK